MFMLCDRRRDYDWYLLGIVVLYVLGVILVYVQHFFGENFSSCNGDWGAFGSYFGGMVSLASII